MLCRKSASTGSNEANESGTSQLADVMAHRGHTAGKLYYISKKQLIAAAGSKALREVVLKQS